MGNRWIWDFLKQAGISISSVGSVFPARATDTDEVRSLIRRLRPRRAQGGLIRIGPSGDGGYLVPDDLRGIEACFSPGVGNIVGFEEACAARGMKVFMADGSVDQPPLSSPAMSFTRRYIGAATGSDYLTLDEWVGSSIDSTETDLLLQIDIEGYEYETFLSVSESLLRRFRIIAAEFHQLDQLWNRPFFRIASRAFEKVLRNHACVHIHPNNCSRPVHRSGLTIPPVMEFTFQRRDRLSGDEFAGTFPHPLDFDNTNNTHYALPACWFSGE